MTWGGLRDLAFRGRDALQEGQAEPLREGRRDDAAAGAVGGRHGDQTHCRAGVAGRAALVVSGIGSHGNSSLLLLVMPWPGRPRARPAPGGRWAARARTR